MKRNIALVIGTAILAISVPAVAQGDDPASVIASTTSLRVLDIAEDAAPTAPDGKLLTLTVDGVESPLVAGHYVGDVVLSVTDDIPVQYHELPTHHFRTALYVADGRVVRDKSVTAAIRSGSIADGKAELLRIQSRGPVFNGIIVTGDGKYEIDRPVIDLTGNGGNDFAGFGAAIMSTGKADVTINRPFIRTRGAVRTALFVGGDSTMRVNDAEIEVNNGTLPPDYKFTVDVGKMMEVPWMLGLSGNVRATNLVDRGTLYINRSHIRAEGWGALSTDDNTHVRMFVTDSLIETIEAGYGSYSIGDSVNVFSHSIINAADIGTIMAAQGSATFTDGTIVNSGRYGIMMHSGAGGGTLVIDKGSMLLSKETAIQVKGLGTTILVDNGVVRAGNGIILQAMENDDPFLIAMMSGQMPEGMGAPPPGMGPDGDQAGKSGPPPSPDVVGTFRDTTMVGDFYNARTSQGGMILRFERASVTGRISTSTTAPSSGKAPKRATYQEIGRVVNTPAPTATANGLDVSLDEASRWTVTGTSYLTSLTLAKGSLLDAGDKRLVMKVNGKTVKPRPGNYRGAIKLSAE